eukprot:scaffold13584_cov30-Tisochrysis_lutea.AAC.6
MFGLPWPRAHPSVVHLHRCGPAFDLPKLLRYRKGEGSAQLAALLARVEPPKLQVSIASWPPGI